jgi:hypothetical protein
MNDWISRGQQGHAGSKYFLKTEITVVMPANFSMNSREGVKFALLSHGN